MDNFLEKLTYLISKRKILQKQLAEEFGMLPTSFSRIMNSKSKPSPQFLKTLDLLYEKYSKTPEVALHDAPMMLREGSWSPPGHSIPVISWARASAYLDHDSANYGDLANQIEEWIYGKTKDLNAYALIVEGPSMEPKFDAGYRIIASPNSEPRNGDYVIARLNDTGQVLFKKYFQTGKDGADVRLECLNPDYSPITLPRAAFRLIHPVVEWHGFRSR